MRVFDELTTTITALVVLLAPPSDAVFHHDKLPGTDEADQGIRVGNTKRIPTNTWFASLLMESEFAKASLPKVAELAPPALFSGQIRSTTIISYLSEPREIRPGEREVDLVATWVLIDRTTGKDERIPFNRTFTRTFTLQAVEVPRSCSAL